MWARAPQAKAGRDQRQMKRAEAPARHQKPEERKVIKSPKYTRSMLEKNRGCRGTKTGTSSGLRSARPSAMAGGRWSHGTASPPAVASGLQRFPTYPRRRATNDERDRCLAVGGEPSADPRGDRRLQALQASHGPNQAGLRRRQPQGRAAVRRRGTRRRRRTRGGTFCRQGGSTDRSDDPGYGDAPCGRLHL